MQLILADAALTCASGATVTGTTVSNPSLYNKPPDAGVAFHIRVIPGTATSWTIVYRRKIRIHPNAGWYYLTSTSTTQATSSSLYNKVSTNGNTPAEAQVEITSMTFSGGTGPSLECWVGF